MSDSFLPTAPANNFLDRLDSLEDRQPIRRALEDMFTAKTGRLPQPPLAVFKMLLLQNCHGLSDPQCEAQVPDRSSTGPAASAGSRGGTHRVAGSTGTSIRQQG